MNTPTSSPTLKQLWTRLAFFISVVGALGSLYLSLEMGLKACPLCFYQRAFIMAAAAVLGFGLFLPNLPSAALSPLALASAVAGFGIALWHTYLDAIGVLECPVGITGVLVAPRESLLVFVLLVACLLVDLFHQRVYVVQGLGAVLLGVVFASTCIRATPKPPEPQRPYREDEKLDGCRKPYKAPA